MAGLHNFWSPELNNMILCVRVQSRGSKYFLVENTYIYGFVNFVKYAHKKYSTRQINDDIQLNFVSFNKQPKKQKNSKVRSQTKKTILFGNFSQPSDPPLLGTPYPKKYEICNMKYEIWNMQYIPCNSALLAQKTLFLTQKGTVFQIYKSFGIWEDPPPCWEKFPNNIVFLWERT